MASPGRPGRAKNLNLRSSEAQTLRQSMVDAYDKFEKARADYERALSTSDSITTLKRLGQDYAQAVERHSTAVMDWLAWVDTKRDL